MGYTTRVEKTKRGWFEFVVIDDDLIPIGRKIVKSEEAVIRESTKMIQEDLKYKRKCQ